MVLLSFFFIGCIALPCDTIKYIYGQQLSIYLSIYQVHSREVGVTLSGVQTIKHVGVILSAGWSNTLGSSDVLSSLELYSRQFGVTLSEVWSFTLGSLELHSRHFWSYTLGRLE